MPAFASIRPACRRNSNGPPRSQPPLAVPRPQRGQSAVASLGRPGGSNERLVKLEVLRSLDDARFLPETVAASQSAARARDSLARVRTFVAATTPPGARE